MVGASVSEPLLPEKFIWACPSGCNWSTVVSILVIASAEVVSCSGVCNMASRVISRNWAAPVAFGLAYSVILVMLYWSTCEVEVASRSGADDASEATELSGCL